MEDLKEISQFDSSLGGQETLPTEVNVLKFAAARSKEIAAMAECILNPCHSKLVFQSLPVHMRRRIMSHNSKRLPRKLRQAHEAQLQKSGLPTKQKRPSRKYRRRPKNLLEEYNRRQREYVWMETHIWHAKRFHMTSKWGYKLPEAPCDKAFRACYRAGSKHCLIQDVSYYCSIQLNGTMEELMPGFKRITSPKCGLGITSRAYFDGKREGSAYVFDIDKYPFNCIGKVNFLWKPNSENIKCVWIFVHPSFYRDFVAILIKCFDLSNKNNISTISESNLAAENAVKPTKRRKLRHNSRDVKINDKLNDEYKNDKTVRLFELKDVVNRFRLTGPLSHAVLSKALIPIANTVEREDSWFNKLCSKNPNFLNVHEVQKNFWSKFQNLSTPAELPCNLIVGLNVKDPRISFPIKRTKAVPEVNDNLKTEDFIIMPNNINNSPLWDRDMRYSISNTIISNLEINKLRENNSLVPGVSNIFLDSIPGVPIILIQRPGSQNSQYKRIGYNSGWEIIIPKGYAMAFWMSFILRGARAGGLRETTNLYFESGCTELQPDTMAYRNEAGILSNLLENKYFRLPPNKRVNFSKLSINSPFLCRWEILINDWKIIPSEMKQFSILRDKTVLLKLQEMINTKLLNPEINWNSNCLVPVKLRTMGKGHVKHFALICVPKKEDSPTRKSSDLAEPLKSDKNQKLRHKFSLEHKTLLKKLRRKAVRVKRKILANSTRYVDVAKQDNSMIINEYSCKMRELWLPSKVENVRRQCTREVMGYVTHGDYSFTEARSVGIGFVALPSLLYLVQNSTSKSLILTRNTTTRQYRYAEIQVICD